MVFSELLVFRDLARAELMSLLAEVPGKKDVVVDPAVLSALEFAIPQDFIMGQAVEGIFPLAEDQPTADSPAQIYVARPLPKMARMIADRARAAKDKQHYAIFIPRRAPVCEKVFEQEGIYSTITVRELNLSLLCLDDDLLSLETPQFYKTFYLAVYEMTYRMMRDCGDDLQKSVSTTPKHSLSSIKRMAENLDAVKHAKLKMHVRLLDRLWQHTHHIEYKEMIEFQKGMVSGEVWARRQSNGGSRSSAKSGRESKEDDKALTYLENCMCRRMPALNALRLLCLYSLTRGGMPDSRWNDLRGMFIKTYGFEHLHTLHRLETLGMIRQESAGAQPVRHTRPVLAASLEHIISKDTWAQAPGDIQAEDGEMFTEHHTLANFASNVGTTTNGMPTPPVQTSVTAASPRDGPECGSDVAVMVVGGITREEIAAMRTVAADSGISPSAQCSEADWCWATCTGRHLVICATNVISGDSFFSELCVD